MFSYVGTVPQAVPVAVSPVVRRHMRTRLKFEHYGVRDVALKWIKRYFSCRQQFSKIVPQRKLSSAESDQGSILGPLFFILYINDLPNASKLTQSLLFADDTGIFYSHSDPNKLHSILNDELRNFDVWLKCNKLSVNLQITNYIIFKSRQKEKNNLNTILPFYLEISL